LALVESEELKYLTKLINLRVLNLQYSEKITKKGVIYLTALTNLKILDISFCAELTSDKGFYELKKIFVNVEIPSLTLW